MPEAPRGWRNRGRLPHADFAGLTQAVTFRLDDALPTEALRQLAERPVPSGDTLVDQRAAVLLRERLQAWLDAGHGSCVLGDPRARQALRDELHRFDGERYRLDGYCVMPNHVHVVVGVGEILLGSIVQAWKGASSRYINLALGRTGRLWGREYQDRFIRDEGHLVAALRYVRENPVKAGLVGEAGLWPGTWLREDLEQWLDGGCALS